MNVQEYDPRFARVYDIIVHGTPEALADADEIAFIERAFVGAERPIRDVLDVGCGAGRYLVPLVAAGYQLTGLDISAALLADCRNRLEARGLEATLVEGDLEQMTDDGTADAVICLDSVICYLMETERIIGALSRFRRALRPGGVLVLDLWNMFGQSSYFGTTITNEYRDDSLAVDWTERFTLDSFSAVFQNEMRVTVTDGTGSHTFERSDVLRALTVGEVLMYLKEAGFVNRSAYPSAETTGDDSTDPEQFLFVAYRPA